MNPNIQRWLDENFVPYDDEYVQDLDTMRLGYVRALLWSEYDITTSDEEGDVETPLQDLFETYELPDEFTARCREEVWQFVELLNDDVWRLDPDMAGIDLWLTRQRTGAGFLDKDWDKLAGREVSKHMDELVKLLFPHETYVYVGDDGELYFG